MGQGSRPGEERKRKRGRGGGVLVFCRGSDVTCSQVEMGFRTDVFWNALAVSMTIDVLSSCHLWVEPLLEEGAILMPTVGVLSGL